MPRVAVQSLRQLTTSPRQWTFPALVLAGRRVGGYRYISLQATPATDSSKIEVIGKSTSATSPGLFAEI